MSNAQRITSYPIGYSDKVVSIFFARSAKKQAAYLIPHLKPGMTLLDCGAGPGSITADLAKLVTPGQVIGIDIEASQIKLAKDYAAKQNILNVLFEKADILKLPYEDNFFDVVHGHGILCQLKNCSVALSEIKRVLKPNGLVAFREPDFDTCLIYPDFPEMMRSMEIAKRSISALGGNCYIGKTLRSLFIEAGFSNVIGSCSCEYRGTLEGIRQESECLINDWSKSPWSKLALDRKWVTHEDIKKFQSAIKKFADQSDAFFSVTWCELLARK